MNYTILNSKTTINNINNFEFNNFGNVNAGTINFFENKPSDSRKTSQQVEDIEPLSESDSTEAETVVPDSFIFTKKARIEHKISAIIHALQNSANGRKDKTRAFVDKLHEWQKEGYMDAHYNAKVMYDELNKLIPLPFGYNAFRKYYTNLL